MVVLFSLIDLDLTSNDISSKREDILNIIEYFKKHPARSARTNCYELCDLGAPEAPQNSLLFKSWLIFINQWNKQVPSSHPDYYTNTRLTTNRTPETRGVT